MEEILRKVEKYRRKLIDVSKRNPLFSFKFKEKSKTHLGIIDEIPDFVLTKLAQGKELTFEYIPNPNDIPKNELTDKYYEILETERLTNKDYLTNINSADITAKDKVLIENELINKVRLKVGFKRIHFEENLNIQQLAEKHSISHSYNLPYIYSENIVPKKHTDNKLQTYLFRDDLNNKLHAIYNKSTNIIKESGVGSLYIIYGNLKWYEDNDFDKPLHTPILLQEVEISMFLKNNEYVYTVKALEDFPTLNLVLQQKLKDHKISINSFDDTSTIDNYFKDTKKIINERFPHWDIINNLTIAIISSTNLILFNDLKLDSDDLNINESQYSLFTDVLGFGDESNNEIVDINHDNLLGSSQMPLLITDADGSQFSAINAVINNSHNVIIQGPPGTGKSQTICNIISSAINNNKTVLFLAEKLAALKVVKSRLDLMKIGDFCLEIHSNKIKKVDIINSLRDRISLKEESNLSSNDFRMDKFIELVKKINLYNEFTNTYNSLFEESYFNLIWKYVNLSHKLNFSNKIDYKIKIALSKYKSKEDIHSIETTLITYKLYKAKFKDKYKDGNNTWKNFILNEKTQLTEDVLIRKVRDFSFEINEIINIDSIYNSNVSVAQIEKDIQILNSILDSTHIKNLDLNHLFNYERLKDDYLELNNYSKAFLKNEKLLNNKFEVGNLSEELLERALSICLDLNLELIDLDALKILNETISRYHETRLAALNLTQIESLNNYLNTSLLGFKYKECISTLLKLIKLENDLQSNYFLNENYKTGFNINKDAIDLINSCSFRDFNLVEISSLHKRFLDSSKKVEQILKHTKNIYDLVQLNISDLDLKELEDIRSFSIVISEYKETFQQYWQNKASFPDLSKIEYFELNVLDIKSLQEQISTSIPIISLDSYNIEELSNYSREYKEKGIFKIFNKSYWKLKNIKKFLSPNLELNILIGIIDKYIAAKNIEIKITTDKSFIAYFGEQESLLNINFRQFIDTLLYKEKVNNLTFNKKSSDIFTNYFLKSNHKQILDFIRLFNTITIELIEDVSSELNLLQQSNILELSTFLQKEIQDIENIKTIFKDLNIKPQLTVKNLPDIFPKLNDWNVTNDNYRKDFKIINECLEKINNLFVLLNGKLISTKCSVSDLKESQTSFLDNKLFKSKIETSSLNKLIKLSVKELSRGLEKLDWVCTIVFQIEESHDYLNKYFKKGNIDLNQTKATIAKYLHKIIDFYSSFNKLQTDSVVNLNNQFETDNLNSIGISEIKLFLDNLLNDIDGYLDYINYNIILDKINEFKLNSFLLDIERNKFDENKVEQYFKLFILSTCIDEFWDNKKYMFIESLSEFGDKLKQFRTLDKDYLVSNRYILKNRLLSRSILDIVDKQYRQERNRLAGQKVGFDLIKNETSKQSRHIPLRSLFQKAGEEVLFFKPCFMMSPQSVSQFLPKDNFSFDIIVIDEASQIKPERCLASLIRGKQLVVVGDSKQLPPTFDMTKSLEDEEIINEDSSIEFEEEEEGIEESILELVNGTVKNNYMLTWHYRSKDPSLINFSNKKFYNEDLVVFPSPVLNSDFGITHYYLEDAIYKNNRNELEAETIVNKLVELLSANSNDSIGVVAVNQKQSNLIDELLFKRIGSSPIREMLFEKATGGDEPLIVKNLENIQGDERDIILISTVYGRDDSGNFYQRFGPINSKYGHRRLNVLFSRARKKILLYTSMRSEDIIDDNKNLGVKILKEYLEYSKTGSLQTSEQSNKGVDSEFEYSVKNMLEANGYIVDTQVGVKGFFIDLAIRDNTSSRYLLGIECDGAPYHSELSARERDRLRQEVLESLGWSIYRILSTNWYHDYENEKIKLLKFLKDNSKK